MPATVPATVLHNKQLLLPRMLCFVLKVAKHLQATSYGLGQTTPSCYLCAVNILTKNSGRLPLQYMRNYCFTTRLHLCTCIARYDLRASFLMNPPWSLRLCKVLPYFLIGLGEKNFLQKSFGYKDAPISLALVLIIGSVSKSVIASLLVHKYLTYMYSPYTQSSSKYSIFPKLAS